MLGLERRDGNVKNPVQSEPRQTALKNLKEVVVTCHLLINLVILFPAGFLKREADQVSRKKVSLVGMNLLDVGPPQLGCLALVACDPHRFLSAGHGAVLGIL